MSTSNAFSAMRALRNKVNSEAASEQVIEKEVIQQSVQKEPVQESQVFNTPVNKQVPSFEGLLMNNGFGVPQEQPVQREQVPAMEDLLLKNELESRQEQPVQVKQEQPVQEPVRVTTEPVRVTTEPVRVNPEQVEAPVVNIDSNPNVVQSDVVDGLTNKNVVFNKQTDVSYSSISSTGLSVLGLHSSSNVSIVKPKIRTDVQPLILENISDSTGDISVRLFNIMVTTGITVLPLKEYGVFESINYIPNFEIIKVKGKTYASYCGDGYPTKNLDSLIATIRNRLINAKYFGISYDSKQMRYVRAEESELKRKVLINNVECEVPALCKSELSHIASYFANYHCNIISVEGDYDNLVVGLPLEGC